MSTAYKKFMTQYATDHEACPKCGQISNFETTLRGYAFCEEYPETYKDLNSCVCQKCGDRHVYHDRVKSKRCLHCTNNVHKDCTLTGDAISDNDTCEEFNLKLPDAFKIDSNID